MAYQYNTPTVASYPTSLNRVLPVVTIVTPSTTISVDRNLTVQWTTDKPGCLFKWSLIGNIQLIPWTNTWSSNTSFSYSNIPNGDYTISVQAQDKWGNESVVTTKLVEVRRAIVPPTLISPVSGDILSTGTVVFRCNVPRNELGDVYHYAFQIEEELNSNPLTKQYVDNQPWFDSRNGYNGFSFTSPVPEDQGGEVTFTKELDMRKNYWWTCRISTLRAGVITNSESAPPQRFTTGVLGTKIVLVAQPNVVRADSVSYSELSAKVFDARDQLDVQWTGTANFEISNGVGSFISQNIGVNFAGGIATTKLTSNIANNVTVQAVANNLLDGSIVVQFVTNRLPEQPTWTPEDGEYNVSVLSETSTKLKMTIPSDADNDLIHLRLEIDTESTFDSPNKIVAETRFSTVGWTYFDGTNEIPYPTAGVRQGIPGTWATYDTGSVLKDGLHYYCRVSAWDNWQA